MQWFTLRCLKSLPLIAASCVLVARADTITETSSTGSFSIPQFNPALGTLTAVDWTFTDYQQYVVYIIQDSVTLGAPYTYTDTEGDLSASLGLDASNVQDFSDTTCGCSEEFFVQEPLSDTVQASGAAPDDSLFIGISSATVEVDPIFGATYEPYLAPPNSGDVSPGLYGISDSMTLTVTYDYVATPEPRDGIAVLGVAFLIALGLKAHRTIRVQ